MMNRFKKALLVILASSFITLIAQAAADNTNNTTLNVPAQTQQPAANPTTQNQPFTGLGPINKAQPVTVVPAPPAVKAKAFVLLDAKSGEILAQDNADLRLEPASLTKIMTLYIISAALKSGQIHLTDMVPISKTAWKTGGSRMFLQVGTQVPVNDLVHGIVIASGNDAAVAMAEYIGGTQENFVNIMNETAANLGMKNTHFMDVNGLPAADHYSSAHDLAILARALVNNFPDYYKSWYGQKWFEFNNIKQANRNKLLWRDSTVDGVKTGHTDNAGYCLVASAERNGMRLISVVLGEPSANTRADDSLALLNWGFRYYETHQLYAANQSLAEIRVWFGKNKLSAMGLAQNLFVTIPRGQYKNLKASLTMDDHLVAPIIKGQKYGQVSITLNDQPLVSQALIALANNPEGNPISKMRDHIIQFFNHSS